MKRLLHFGAALLISLAVSATLHAQARPMPGPDVQKVYDRLLKQIDQIPIYDNHSHATFPDDSDMDAMVSEYRRRRDEFVAGLNRIPGFRCQAPDGAFYAWVNIEDTGLSAEEVQKLLLEEAGVAGIAGAAFGPGGRNYLRFSLVSARNLLEEALERMHRVSVHWRAAVSR